MSERVEAPSADATDGDALLEAEGLVREYGPVVAVDGIGLTLAAGDFLTIFGPNGAGKTSLLGVLAGRLRPTRGEVRIAGRKLDFEDGAWRHRVGVLSHRGYLYEHLTPTENLRFYGRLFGLDDLRTRIPERLEGVGLGHRADFPVRQLSHGMRQRLALARTLLHDPDVVFLDEPYTGLDPSAASLLKGVLASLKDGRRTVVMVTHNLTEGLDVCTRAAIQVAGRFAWQGPPAEMRAEGHERFYHRVVDGAR